MTKIEQVAEALWYYKYPSLKDKVDFKDFYKNDRYNDFIMPYINMAKIAVMIMREPTEEMYNALNDKMWRETNSTEVWQKMIDAALKE